MQPPRMVIVAGPSGGGKSTMFPIFQMNLDAFSTDLRAATLLGIARGKNEPVFLPDREDSALYMAFRRQAGREPEQFINQHIDEQKEFAFETTIRDVTFGQARRAAQNGFRVEMLFVAAGDEDEHVRRVHERAARGGHVASEGTLRDIYRRGMAMLPRAFEENRLGNIEVLAVFHNPRVAIGEEPRPALLVEMIRGRPAPERGVSNATPPWFDAAVRGTAFTTDRLRALLPR